MKQICVRVPDGLHREVRVRAAQLGVSVEPLLREFLEDFASGMLGGTAPIENEVVGDVLYVPDGVPDAPRQGADRGFTPDFKEKGKGKR